MADQMTQDGRQLSITTPLGKDVLLIDSFVGTEAVSRPFSFDVELVAEIKSGNNLKVDPEKLIGKPMTITIETEAGDARYINGIVRRFAIGLQDTTFAHYRAELVPTLSMLALRSSLRIFQMKTVPDIVSQIFHDAGLSDFRLVLTRTYTSWDYCVQYRESDLNFVSRLLEEEGIFYYFEHEESKHTLVLADAPSAVKACPGKSSARFGTDVLTDEDIVTALEVGRHLHSGKWSLRDHAFELPRSQLEATTSFSSAAPPEQKLEIYDYPGGYSRRFNATGSRLGSIQTEGNTVVGLREDEGTLEHKVVQGASNCRAFTAGYKVTIEGVGMQSGKDAWLLTAVQHSASQSPAYLGADSLKGSGYDNRFAGIPAATKYRPPRVTPKPFVQGPQTAIVVDESSSGTQEEIWPDKYGRVRVRFFWDRDGKFACWVRVGQTWAGKSWGQIWIPRTGDEVIVDFLEGDPDQPIIVGSVYNADNMPPFALPANKTQSGLVTRSTPKGESANFNMLRFEDKKGSEEVMLHAERTLTTEVEVDENRAVGNNRTTTIAKDDTKTIKKGNESTTIEEGNQVLELQKGDRNVTLDEGDQTTQLEKGDVNVVLQQGDHATFMKEGNHSLLIEQGNDTVELKTGDQQITLKMGDQTVSLGMGNQNTKLDLGKISSQAMQGIELKVGQSSIVIDQMGVHIKGMMVELEGQIQTSVKGMMTQINGNAMVQVQGAITMIN